MLNREPGKRSWKSLMNLITVQMRLHGDLQVRRQQRSGFIIPDVTNVYFSSLARGIDDVATMYKYNIILANSDGNEEKEIQVFNTLLAKQVDGIIYMGTHLTEKLREQIKRSKTPVVLAGSIDHKNEFVSVHVDYVKAVKEAVNNLLAHGDKRVAFVSGPLNYPINSEYRFKGI